MWSAERKIIARRCGTKHMSKPKCEKKKRGFGALLDGEMLKKCTVVARSKNVQNTPFSEHVWKLRLRCSKVHAVVARSTCRSQNVK